MKYEELTKKSGGQLSTGQLAVLVAFNLAEELLETQAKLRTLKKEVVEKTERLLDRVESHLEK
jgi:cell division protein ZapA (FtsZ GTPase activity inhibitor)